MKSRITLGVILASVLLALSCYWLGFQVSQNSSVSIIISYGVAFIAYGCLINLAIKESKILYILLALGILVRLLLVFGFPTLSDDIYRFLWDGRLIHEGIHPLMYKPIEYLELTQDNWFSELFPKLNSPEYFTVYPPLSQLVFYLSTITTSWVWSTVIMKLILFLFELGTCYLILQLLKRIGRPSYWVLIYFLNPLVIVELTGQLHYEGIMIFFLAACLYAIERKKHGVGGVMIAASVGVKLLPVMFLPVLLNYLKNNKDRWHLILGFGVTSMVLFIPFLLTLDLGHFLDSLNLYFQKFEFNASVYYLVRGLGYYLTGYNQIAIIGPLLSILSLGMILRISFKRGMLEWGSGVELYNLCASRLRTKSDFDIYRIQYSISGVIHGVEIRIPEESNLS